MRREVETPVGVRDQISTPIEPHNRPYRPNKLEGAEHARNELRNRAATAKVREVASARTYLSKASPSSAIEYMQQLPLGQLELYYLVEEAGENRSYVLQYFPKPGHIARDRWAATISGETPKRRAPKQRSK